MLCIDTLPIEEAATGMDEWFSRLGVDGCLAARPGQ